MSSDWHALWQGDIVLIIRRSHPGHKPLHITDGVAATLGHHGMLIFAAMNTAASDEVLRSGSHARNSLRPCNLAVQPGITTLQSHLSRRQTSRKASCLLDCMRMLTWTCSPSCISAKVVSPFQSRHCLPIAKSIGYSLSLMHTGQPCILGSQGRINTEMGTRHIAASSAVRRY